MIKLEHFKQCRVTCSDGVARTGYIVGKNRTHRDMVDGRPLFVVKTKGQYPSYLVRQRDVKAEETR